MRLIDADTLTERLTVPDIQITGLGLETVIAVRDVTEIIQTAPTVEPKRGRWVERRVSYVPDSDIYEMQSAKCSACGLYHTTPYQYSFTDYNFCPHCGVKMEMSENDG